MDQSIVIPPSASRPETTDAGGSKADLRAIIDAIKTASIQISNCIALGTFVPSSVRSASRCIEVKPETRPDRSAERILVEALRDCGVKEVVSAGRERAISLDGDGHYAVAVDALDGASNIDTNMPLGTIFSVSFASGAATPRSGAMQIAAGLIIYGPQTNLVLTIGDGVDIFRLDREQGIYRLFDSGIHVRRESSEFAIDASNYRHWPSAVRTLIDDHRNETGEPGAQTFNMRWIGSFVAEAYRVLVRGGVFLCPPDRRRSCEHGCQRLMTAAHPIAFIMEQAGAGASTGYGRVLDRSTTLLNERTSLIFGSRDTVEKIERLHALPESFSDTAPLFGSRGLFRD